MSSPPRYKALSLPYPPCTHPLHDLKATKFLQLELGSHNRGKSVLVRRRGQLICLHTSTLCGVMDLGFGGNCVELGDQDVRVDGIRVVDVFQVHDIVARNSFGIPTPNPCARTDQWRFYTAQPGPDRSTNLASRNSAIFCHAAFINHSCLPNVRTRFTGDIIIIRATRPINKGEETLVDYAPGEFHNVRSRKQGFERTRQFSCDCELYTAENKQTDEVLHRRITRIRQADELSEELSRTVPASTRWDATISSLEGLAIELSSTHRPSELPKPLAYNYTTLALLHGARKDFPSHLQAVGQPFESLG